jgi:succinate dehydrogenase / fumarate reductase cytochrome b subunit
MTLKNNYNYLNLLEIKLPIPGIVSIAHRVSGVLMFIAIPFVAYLLEQSVSGPQSYQEVSALLAHPAIKLGLIIIGWSLVHHLYAGVRYLLIDADIGVELYTARLTAKLVMMATVISTLGMIWVIV